VAARVEFPRVFTELKKLFRPFARRFKVIANTPATYYLEGAYSEKHKRAIWFGGVQQGKAYVSFHLIGVYAFPGLLKGASPKLRARMQGRACFNFTMVDPPLFRELGRLAKESFHRFKKEKWV
jgi:hypothetical protein